MPAAVFHIAHFDSQKQPRIHNNLVTLSMDHCGGTAQEAYENCSFLSPTPDLEKFSEGCLKNPGTSLLKWFCGTPQVSLSLS